MQSEWLSDIFHIPDAATTGDPGDYCNGVKSGKAQNGNMFSALSSIANIDRRLWVRHLHADKKGATCNRYTSKSVANNDLPFVIWRKDDVYRP